MTFSFASPWWLLLLIVLPLQVWWHTRGTHFTNAVLRLPSATSLRQFRPSTRVRLRHVVLVLQILGELILIVALARPRSGKVEQRVISEGVDIVLALDVSGSMQAFDMGNRERIDVAKEVTSQFIDSRASDRLGMVVFAGQSYTQCPLTVDYGILKNLLAQVSIRMNETIPDGTAIGMALATATNRLRKSTAPSKVIVLLTDGSNNAGIIDPLTAAEAAAQLGIRVYAIAVGVTGRAPIRVRDPLFGERIEFMEDSINEDVLREIAAITGGRFFRATSQTALQEIYREIGMMEKTEVATLQIPRFAELTFVFHLIPLGLGLLILGSFLRFTVFRTIP
ncbi:MAG TPA: VWA domain-containing protein [Candidatus Latescibacteria bacterium]|nr:VWA domain-containing protein [Candidatus Latescibacterota bacterium]